MKKCENCDDCVYIGEGDYICIKGDEPGVVIEEFIIATDEYGSCKNKIKNAARTPSKVVHATI
ncbi:hypothetical protein [uncultured Clostridium sp.]|uniref:hypothetical protein n=1 Tax=uncultured Clostridium sp. TaxID=59620 RepID=UPI0028EB9E6C|nr:hypothetical protein [uncultured Clostridium sp.]